MNKKIVDTIFRIEKSPDVFLAIFLLPRIFLKDCAYNDTVYCIGDALKCFFPLPT